MTAACVSMLTFFGTSPTATADPTNNDKLFAELSGGYTPSDCKAGKQYPEDPFLFLARLGCGPNSQPGGPNAATQEARSNWVGSVGRVAVWSAVSV